MSSPIISPSLLAADFKNLEKEISALNQAGCSSFHLDVMDGHFVPNLTFGPFLIKQIRSLTKAELNGHLMIANPMDYISNYAEAGCDIITIHAEIKNDIITILKKIKKTGKKAGLAINPQTSLTNLPLYLPYLDYILIMSVNPGFCGQKFISSSLKKITTARQLISQQKHPINLGIDGGINHKNIKKTYQAGANVFVSGSTIFKHSEGPAKGFQVLTELIK